MITGNEPIYPTKGSDDRFFSCNNEAEYIQWMKQTNPSIGLTKREHFAAMAIQGLMATPEKGYYSNIEESARVLSKYAVMVADALITELNNKP